MIRFLVVLILSVFLYGNSYAQKTESFTNKVKDGYNFWLYTPKTYKKEESKPLVIFLHGRSLCGSHLHKVRRYGTLHAIDKGREIDALVLAPQNPGGSWNPQKILNTLRWTKDNYNVDTNRVYVIGISLGGYGTLDFTGTFPDKIAASIALCGGTTLTDFSGLSKVPLWIFHGTADRAVPISASQKVVDGIKSTGDTCRYIFTRLQGFNHGGPAKILYMEETYDWLLEHSLQDNGRPVNKTYSITPKEIKNAYQGLHR